MGRPYAGPRLYQKPRRGKPDIWVIRDGEVEISTGCRDQEKAQKVIEEYCREKNVELTSTPRAGQRKWPSTTVYFISTDDVPNYPIKIGVSDNGAEKRMWTLQNACPYKLRVLASFVGDRSIELSLHRKFAAYRMEREWFARHDDLMDHIAALAQTKAAA